jgi:hypothetical protein
MRFVVSIKPNGVAAALRITKVADEVRQSLPESVRVEALRRLPVLIVSCPDSLASEVRTKMSHCEGVEEVVEDFDLQSPPFQVEAH